MEIDLTYDDIDITHRLNKGHKSPRPIIVRFSNYYSKEQMYRGRWKLRKKSGLKGLGVDPKKVYINENLTAYRAGLFKTITLHNDMRNGNENCLQYRLFSTTEAGTLTYNKRLFTDVNKYRCLTKD